MTASSLLGKRAGARSYRRPSRTRAGEDCWIGALGVAAPVRALYRHGPTLPPIDDRATRTLHCPHKWEEAIRSRSGEVCSTGGIDGKDKGDGKGKCDQAAGERRLEVTGPRHRGQRKVGRGAGKLPQTPNRTRSRPTQRLGRSISRSLRLLLRRAREGCRAGLRGVVAT